eukprot:CAMPEP_0115017504 /NCGR_PEP_ID=MMETSP0216-20121206/28170_1 /TAXON_ID=223996 /ORGANISM="Protocruzia adherens, Strain Boccale" /LENGTH=261 /DNA_ID=CAMNT_0002388361 /DNA_START=1157 /DNA_END=1942 /DNA_ORIENTATION=+
MRFLSLYYIVNTLIILIYPIARVRLDQKATLYIEDFYGGNRESQVLFTLVILIFSRLIREPSMEAMISKSFLFLKIGFVALFYMIKTRYAVFYAVICFLSWLFIPQPRYQGPTKMITIPNVEAFEERVEDGYLKYQRGKKKATRDPETKEYWLVEFYTVWADTCLNTEAMWANFSNRYTTPRLKFGRVDLDQIPELARRYDINTGAMSRQLPTLVLFENGEESIRFPPVRDGKVAVALKYKAKEIKDYFNLGKIYLSTREG